MRKKAYVTGADRGLGLALTQRLLGLGYKVYAGSFMPDWHELIELVKQHGDDNIVVVPLDVTDSESVKHAANLISQDTDYLNLVINNAGIATEVDRETTIFDEEHDEDIRKIIETNALGPLRVTKSVLNLLLQGDSKVLVNISSVAASISNLTRVNQYGYCMSKVALNIQSKLLHNQLKQNGVKVMIFHPGWMPSYIFGDPDKMLGAPVHLTEAAKGILDQVETQQNKVGEFSFTDHSGNTIAW